jgi:hypothetical protein
MSENNSIQFTQDEIQRKGKEIVEREVYQNVNETMERIQAENIDEYLDAFSARDISSELEDDFSNGYHVDEFLEYLDGQGNLDEALTYLVGAKPVSKDDIEVGSSISFINKYGNASIETGEVESIDHEEETITIDGDEYDLNDLITLSGDKITINVEQAIQYLEGKDGIAEFAEEVGVEGYEIEVYEHWSVTNRLASQLKASGELVGEFEGMNVWGRQATGQAIFLDYVIQEMAKKELAYEYDYNIAEARRGNATVKGIVDEVHENSFVLKVGNIPVSFPYENAMSKLVELDPVMVTVNSKYVEVEQLDRSKDKSVER